MVQIESFWRKWNCQNSSSHYLNPSRDWDLPITGTAGVIWREHITNEAICKQTQLAPLTELISRRRMSLFGHIARLDAAVPAHQALWLQTNISTGRNPGTSWKRLPGRPRKT